MTISFNPYHLLVYVPAIGVCYFMFLARRILWADRVIITRILIGLSSLGCVSKLLYDFSYPPKIEVVPASQTVGFQNHLHQVLPGKWLGLYTDLLALECRRMRCEIVQKFAEEKASGECRLPIAGYDKIHQVMDDDEYLYTVEDCLGKYLELSQDK